MDPIPVEADGVLESSAQHGLVGQTVDQDEGFGQRQRGRAPDRVGVHGLDRRPAVPARRGGGRARALVSRTSVTRRAARRGAGRAGRPPTPGSGVRAAAGRGDGGRRPGPAPTRSRACGARPRVERSELGHRPAADRDDDALAGSRPAAPGALARRSRMPTRSIAATTPVVYTRVHRPTGREPTRRRLGRMNFAFSEEQEELRKTVRSFLESKSPESEVRRADGHRGRLRPRRLEPDGRADGPAGSGHPRGVRRLGLQLRRARRRAGGDGPGAAVRAVLLDRRPRRQHAAAARRRRGQEGLPARHRRRRDDRHAGLHRAVRQVGRERHHHGGHAAGRRLGAERHEDVRDRRPHRRPGHRGRPHRRPASACSRSWATPPA